MLIDYHLTENFIQLCRIFCFPHLSNVCTLTVLTTTKENYQLAYVIIIYQMTPERRDAESLLCQLSLNVSTLNLECRDKTNSREEITLQKQQWL